MEEGLAPRLEKAQETLKKALDEACTADLSKADTGEMIRIEEALAEAASAAKEAISVRLRRRTPGKGVGTRLEDTEPSVAHRVFEDSGGKRWHVFAVQHPEASDRATLPESFRLGWLAFESDDELRRVAPIPENWARLPLDELRRLCQSAKPAPRRTGRPGGKPDQDRGGGP